MTKQQIQDEALAKVKIESITVKALYDDTPDTSFLGEYTDDMEPGVIVRQDGEFYEKLPAKMERDIDGTFLCKGEPEVPPRGREYRGFRPYAGGEKVGTKDYYKYGMQDYKRMEGLERGDWSFIGIMAKAVVSYRLNGYCRLETFTSGGLWGIETDAGEYLDEVKTEELDGLKNHLEAFGVDLSNWDKLTKDIEIEHT